MRSKKITAAVLGIVLTLGLVVSGCGSNNGTSSDGSAKAEKNKDGYEVVTSVFQVPDMNGQREHWQWQRKKDIWMNI